MKRKFFILSFVIFLLNCPSSIQKDNNERSNDIFSGAAKRDMISVTGGTYIQTDGTFSFNHTLSGFMIAKYEVTYELWYTVKTWASLNGYSFANAGREGSNGAIGALPTAAKYRPVTTVNWRDAIVWCNAYSQMSGLTPSYTYLSAIIKDSRDTNAAACDNAVCTWLNNGYRLPSEGEWQFAASNKGATPWNYASGAAADYSNAVETQKVAWYGANSGGITHDVGTTTIPNALNLYDMSGNILELCWDWYNGYPGNSTNYRGDSSGTIRQIRGGSFTEIPGNLTIGIRGGGNPYSEGAALGFRVVRSF